jgi:hypothetical protein
MSIKPIQFDLGSFLLPSTEPLPPKDISGSPSKRKFTQLKFDAQLSGPLLEGAKKTKKQRALNFDATASQYTVQTLPPLLKIQADMIENRMVGMKLSVFSLCTIRAKICSITQNPVWSEERKAAELGLLYCYLASEKQMPEQGSFLTARRDEIEMGALQLKEEHKSLCGKKLRKLLPSGYIAHILRAFVRMIFTPDGNFNLGGCYGVKELLNTRLSLYLTEELRKQILTVVERLIQDDAFRNCFKDPFTIHDDLKELISIDIKVPVIDQVNFVYVRWDLLLALFSIIGQLEEGNCYAVAATSNLLGRHCDVLLKLLIDVLKTGKLGFEGLEIPVLTLLESRRKYEQDFSSVLTKDKAVNLTGYAVASALLGVETESKSGSADTVSLSVLMQNSFGQNTEYAKEIFLSHKQNLLQQMLIAIIHFVSLNLNKVREVNGKGYRSWKQGVLSEIKNKLFAVFKQQYNGLSVLSTSVFTDFLGGCEQALSKYFFVVDFRNWKKDVRDGHVFFDFHSQGLQFNGTLSDYDPFMRTRRLYFLKEGKLLPVDSLTFLGACLAEIAERESAPLNSAVVKSGCDLLKSFFTSEMFKEEAAKLVQKENGGVSKLAWELYRDSDAFFLVQRGGDSGMVTLWDPIKDRVAPPSMFASQNPLHFFIALCTKISKYVQTQPGFATQDDPQLLISTVNHAFNLHPLHFQKYWEAPADAIWKMHEQARCILSQRIKTATQLRILNSTLGFENIDFAKQLVSKRPIGLNRFKKEALKALKSEYHARFQYFLDCVLQEITCETVQNKLPDLLKAHGIVRDEKGVDVLFDYIDKRWGATSFSSFKLATLLHKALLICEPATYVPVYLLEQTIRTAYSLPQVIDLGNLNWVSQLSEKLIYSRLVLKFNLFTERLELCQRINGIDEPLAEDFLSALYKGTEIYFET